MKNASSEEACVVLTPGLIEEYVGFVRDNGRSGQTAGMYRRSLMLLYDFLPEDKRLTGSGIAGWVKSLYEEGYGTATVNTRKTALNGLLKYCGKGGMAMRQEKAGERPVREELTPEEYLRLLAAAGKRRNKREYLLIKAFASIGVGVRDVGRITVEACFDGELVTEGGARLIIPRRLAWELAEYARECGQPEGPVFVTRSGKSVDRSNVAHAIKALAEEAGVDPAKCGPRGLHGFWLATRKEIDEQMRPFVSAAYDRAYDVNNRQTEDVREAPGGVRKDGNRETGKGRIGF